MDRVLIRLGATLVLSAMLAILAAGCGGETSAEEEWAGDMCTAVGGWQDQVEQSADDVTEQLQSPGAGTLAAIDAEIQEAIDATEKLGDDLNELEPPDSEAGDEAQQDLDALDSPARFDRDEHEGDRRQPARRRKLQPGCGDTRSAGPFSPDPRRKRVEHARVGPRAWIRDQGGLRQGRFVRGVSLGVVLGLGRHAVLNRGTSSSLSLRESRAVGSGPAPEARLRPLTHPRSGGGESTPAVMPSDE